MKEPRAIALQLLQATALPDEQIYTGLSEARYTTVDYYRMACHIFLSAKDAAPVAPPAIPSGSGLRMRLSWPGTSRYPLSKAIKKYTVPDPDKPGALDFKHILPCKFYDARALGCKIYPARPWSCRIFPFLGIYGCEDRVVVNESCPGSVQTMKALTAALEEVRSDSSFSVSNNPNDAKRAKDALRAALSAV